MNNPSETIARAAADAEAAASIITLSDDREMRQNTIIIDRDGRIVGFEAIPCEMSDPFPTRAEFDALLARLAVAEAEIKKLKGRGPDFEGAF